MCVFARYATLVPRLKHAQIQKVFSEGVQLWQRFLLLFFFLYFLFSWWGDRIPLPLIVGHHPPASETFHWPADDDPTVYMGFGPVLLRDTIALWFSRVGGEGEVRTPCPHPLWIHAGKSEARKAEFPGSAHLYICDSSFHFRKCKTW